MPNGKLRVLDKGYAKRVRQIIDAAKDKKVLRVGITGDEGSKAYDDGMTVLEVAIINEFGLGNVPERSFIRAWFEENKDKAQKQIGLMMKSVAQGKRTLEQVYQILGARFAAEIRRRIAEGIPPPNAPSTIARKGSSKPLIDTGVLRSSVTFEVKDRE